MPTCPACGNPRNFKNLANHQNSCKAFEALLYSTTLVRQQALEAKKEAAAGRRRALIEANALKRNLQLEAEDEMSGNKMARLSDADGAGNDGREVGHDKDLHNEDEVCDLMIWCNASLTVLSYQWDRNIQRLMMRLLLLFLQLFSRRRASQQLQGRRAWLNFKVASVTMLLN